MPEATFFVTISMWPLQSSLPSLVTPSDFAVVTWLTWKSLIASVGDYVRVLSLCLDPRIMNSVLVIFRMSLFAFSQLWTLSKSWFRCNWILSALSPAHVRWVSSAYILGSQFDRQFGRSLIYSRNSSGPKIDRWKTPQLSEQLLESDRWWSTSQYDSLNMTETMHLCALPYMP